MGNFYNRGIKHDFPFIYIRKVLREVLKTEGEYTGFVSVNTCQLIACSTGIYAIIFIKQCCY